MHLSIISYALDVPSVNLVWNDKIPFFYQNIGYPDRAISIEDWNAEDVLKRLSEDEEKRQGIQAAQERLREER